MTTTESSTHKVSPSQLSMWRNCPKAWDYAYVQGIKRKQNNSKSMDVGLYFHELAHVYYQLMKETKRKPGDSFLVSAINSRIRRDLESATSDNIMIINTVSKMIVRYITEWSPTLDAGIEVLEVEINLQAPVKLPSGREIILNCITDLIYKDRAGTIVIRDHKTGKSGTWSQNSIPLLDQLLFNSAVWFLLTGQLAPKVEISYINNYNYKTKTPSLKEMFESFIHVHNEHAIKFYTEQLLRMLDRMVNDDDPVRFYSKDCASCQYQPICAQELRGYNTDSLIRTQYEKVVRDYEVRPRTLVEATAVEVASENPCINPATFSLQVNL
jgi:hypothetical protein